MVSRRKTLALIGGGTVVAAGAAVAGFVVTRTPNQALATLGSGRRLRGFAQMGSVLCALGP